MEQGAKPESPKKNIGEEKLRAFYGHIALIAFALLVLGLTGGFLYQYLSPDKTALKDHWLAHPGMAYFPAGIIAAMAIVMVFKATVGQIEFEVLGFKFSGASGPIVMWVLCFLAIVFSIKLLWNLE